MLATARASTACGGSDDDDPETGVFTDGPVQGVRYVSGDLSGMTNARGEFEYRPGDSVTFSLGAVTLGSAPGADLVTPFDLFDLRPPTDTREIRRQLEGRDDLILRNRPAEADAGVVARGPLDDSGLAARHAGRAFSDLQRVANVATILVTLDRDRDRDPANGLDLRDWHQRLADSDLEIDLPPANPARIPRRRQ